MGIEELIYGGRHLGCTLGNPFRLTHRTGDVRLPFFRVRDSKWITTKKHAVGAAS